MNEKKLKIMDIGLTLFSEKGYHSTSIQEIATEAGISKGAFYLYYQSKEDFMASSIDYIYLKIMNRLDQISNEELLPREKLAQQINILLGYIESYKGFKIGRASCRECVEVVYGSRRLSTCVVSG